MVDPLSDSAVFTVDRKPYEYGGVVPDSTAYLSFARDSYSEH